MDSQGRAVCDNFRQNNLFLLMAVVEAMAATDRRRYVALRFEQGKLSIWEET